jgi:Uma2 family endonuclease
MADVAENLTLAEFELQFGNEKPYYEFWAGTAVQKSMPTWMHGFLQKILMQLLVQLGLFSASEVRVKINANLELVPDVIATDARVRSLYALTPPLVAIEILSPDDPAQRLWKKCALYSKWGIPAVYVVDPEARRVRIWNNSLDTFSTVTEIQIERYGSFSVDLIWQELDRQIEV